MNELEFGAPLPVGMAAVLKQRLSPRNLSLTMLTAKRWVAEESLKVSSHRPSLRLPPPPIFAALTQPFTMFPFPACQENIVDEIVPGDSEATIARALEVAQAHAKFASTGVLGQMKTTLYADVLEGLRFDDNLPSTTLAQQNQLKVDELAKALTMAKL